MCLFLHRVYKVTVFSPVGCSLDLVHQAKGASQREWLCPSRFRSVGSRTAGYKDLDQLAGTISVYWGQILASPLCQIFHSGHVISHPSSKTQFPSLHTEVLVSTLWHSLWIRWVTGWDCVPLLIKGYLNMRKSNTNDINDPCLRWPGHGRGTVLHGLWTSFTHLSPCWMVHAERECHPLCPWTVIPYEWHGHMSVQKLMFSPQQTPLAETSGYLPV